MKTNTDEKKIDEILSRSVAQILPKKEVLKKELLSGRRLKIYFGADPTGPQFHIGHATNFILLEKLRQLGHEIVILFGDFTAKIGDPTDKEAARRKLSDDEIEENVKTWKEQVSKVLNLEDKANPVKFLKNSAWHSKLTLSDTIELAAYFTVQQMIERDMFQKRLKDRKPIYLHEFIYPLLQGYDSVAMDVDMEVGGTDQIFNMLVGRTLQKKINRKEKFVFATPLLFNPKTGKKFMSKSEGTYIALGDNPTDMYGKTMAVPDEAMIQIFTDCTRAPLDEIRALEEQLQGGTNPRDIKMKLAFKLVKTYHNEGAAKSAQEIFIKTFKKGIMPDDAEEVVVESGTLLVDVLLQSKLVPSKSEFRRLITGRAIEEVGGEIIENAEYSLVRDIDLKIGKKRFLKIRVS